MQDYRKYARIKVLIPCAIRVAQTNPSDAWGHIHDISVGGVELHTYFPVVKGQTLFLTFSVDEMFTFAHAKCTVLRLREDQGYLFAGISFDEVVDKNHLRDALQSLLDKG